MLSCIVLKFSVVFSSCRKEPIFVHNKGKSKNGVWGGVTNFRTVEEKNVNINYFINFLNILEIYINVFVFIKITYYICMLSVSIHSPKNI